MSWHILSRRIHSLRYALNKTEVAGSLVQRNKFAPYTFHHAERYCPSFELRRHYSSNAVQEKKSWKKLMYMTTLVSGMAGFSYAAFLLYQRFCVASDDDDNFQRHETVEERKQHSEDGIVAKREITVQFNVDITDGMPWKFIPMQREVMVKPGESALAYYTAENKSSTPIVGVPTYKVTPIEATAYFKCFCLEEQQLLPGQEVEMPVFFYIDPALEKDPKMDDIKGLSLSYAFVEVSK